MRAAIDPQTGELRQPTVEELQALDREQAIAAIIEQVRSQTRHLKAMPAVRASELIIEKRATFAAIPGLRRPSVTTPWPAIRVAGDWTDTGWPPTMEGAVRSGYRAAEAVARPMPAFEAAPAVPGKMNGEPFQWIADADVRLAPPDPANMETWVELAETQSYPVLVQEATAEIAALEARRASAAHHPTLDIVATLLGHAPSPQEISQVRRAIQSSYVYMEMALDHALMAAVVAHEVIDGDGVIDVHRPVGDERDDQRGQPFHGVRVVARQVAAVDEAARLVEDHPVLDPIAEGACPRARPEEADASG